MRGGRLRDLVRIEVATRAKDGVGGQRVTWNTAPQGARVFAQCEATSGGEGLAEDKLTASRRWTVTLRYRPDVEPANYRFVFGGKLLAIIDTLPDQKREMIACTCEEGRANSG